MLHGISGCLAELQLVLIVSTSRLRYKRNIIYVSGKYFPMIMKKYLYRVNINYVGKSPACVAEGSSEWTGISISGNFLSIKAFQIFEVMID